MKNFTETDIQKILFNKFMERSRRTYKITIPNIYMYDSWESDFLGMTPYFYFHEYEIKLTKEDYFADFNKELKHNLLRSFYKSPSPYHNIPKRFYYVIHGFWLKAGELPPYAGMIVVSESGQLKTIRRAPDLPAQKVNDKQIVKLATSLSHRYWKML